MPKHPRVIDTFADHLIGMFGESSAGEGHSQGPTRLAHVVLPIRRPDLSTTSGSQEAADLSAGLRYAAGRTQVVSAAHDPTGAHAPVPAQGVTYGDDDTAD